MMKFSRVFPPAAILVLILALMSACGIYDPGDLVDDEQIADLEGMVDDWAAFLNAQYEPGLQDLFAPNTWVYSATNSQWTIFLPQVMSRSIEIDPVAEEMAYVDFTAYRDQGEILEREIHWELIKVEGDWRILVESWRSP